MNYRFNLQLAASLPVEEGFSLDELVTTTKRMLEAEGMAGLIDLIENLLTTVTPA